MCIFVAFVVWKATVYFQSFAFTSFSLTSSSRLLCSFCSSMRFCLSANSKRLCSSFCCCSSCCRRWASERSLLASCRRRKSRLRVDSPGMLMMELERWTVKKTKSMLGEVGQNMLNVHICAFVKTLTSGHNCLCLHPPLHCHYTHILFHLVGREIEWGK